MENEISSSESEEIHLKLEMRLSQPLDQLTPVSILMHFENPPIHWPVVLHPISSEGTAVTAKIKVRTLPAPDFTFYVKGKTFKINKKCVAGFSTRMEEIFEAPGNFYEEKDVSSANFERFMRFIFFRDIPADTDDVESLCRAAHFYGIEKLVAACESRLMEGITILNAIGYIDWSEFGCLKLQAKANLTMDEYFKADQFRRP